MLHVATVCYVEFKLSYPQHVPFTCMEHGILSSIPTNHILSVRIKIPLCIKSVSHLQLAILPSSISIHPQNQDHLKNFQIPQTKHTTSPFSTPHPTTPTPLITMHPHLIHHLLALALFSLTAAFPLIPVGAAHPVTTPAVNDIHAPSHHRNHPNATAPALSNRAMGPIMVTPLPPVPPVPPKPTTVTASDTLREEAGAALDALGHDVLKHEAREAKNVYPGPLYTARPYRAPLRGMPTPTSTSTMGV